MLPYDLVGDLLEFSHVMPRIHFIVYQTLVDLYSDTSCRLVYATEKDREYRLEHLQFSSVLISELASYAATTTLTLMLTKLAL